MLAWIQEELSLTDFKEDSRKQRLRGLHISGLRSNLGEKEFLRRWKTLIGDAFKKERCSSLDYIYSEMKAGFDASADKAKKKKKRESAEESEKKAEEAKRQADAAERKKLEELMESLTPEEINDIENEAKESLIKVGITLYSETKKGRPEAFQKMLKGSILSIIKRKYASNL